MDFSLPPEALTSNSYEKVANICDEHMLRVAAECVACQDYWPYAIHLLGHIYAVIACGFLWKSMPASLKQSNPEVIAAWKIGQKLWMRDYGGVYESIRGYDWSQEAQGLVAAFSVQVHLVENHASHNTVVSMELGRYFNPIQGLNISGWHALKYRSLHKEYVSAPAVCLFYNKHPRHISLPWNERG